ncbi:MAG: DUF1552 domain-containing protein [Verrucomicrobiales bacterium]|nr:DUF1552 domain-containing protein [Verrucomicrobiales bacterium]
MQRRQFIRDLGFSAAALPFLTGLPGLQAASANPSGKKRLIIMFSPNGTIPDAFWPKTEGSQFELPPILEPLKEFKKEMLVLNGIYNQVRGDGDNHMRGMSCLLTGSHLFPGNIQGGSDTPAGWASGLSIDQEIRNHYQKNASTKTRFGSLEFGVAVPNRADPWTRMVYAGPNKPIAPIADPKQMLDKLYGNKKDAKSVISILDPLRDDIKRASTVLGKEDRHLLDEHLTLVRQMESDLKESTKETQLSHPVPDIDPDIELLNDNTPQISRMQIDLLVNSMANDMTRIATLQQMRSVGQSRMHWLGIDDGHHGLSHEPDDNQAAKDKLIKINRWFSTELAYLTKKLKDTPEPSGSGSMLDHTLIVWTNELGKGNSHTLDNIPFVLIGGKAHGIKTGRYLKADKVAHNRLLMGISQSMGHPLKSFGDAKHCEGGAFKLSA